MKHSGTGLLLVLFLTMMCNKSSSQSATSLNQKLITSAFKEDKYKEPLRRKVITFKKKSSYYNPANYLGAGLLFFYQRVISEQIQAECTYNTSCSEFTKLSIEKYGIFKGGLKGINQLSECFPGAKSEHIRYYISSEDKIINKIEFDKD